LPGGIFTVGWPEIMSGALQFFMRSACAWVLAMSVATTLAHESSFLAGSKPAPGRPANRRSTELHHDQVCSRRKNVFLDGRLIADARDGHLDEFDFVSACLIASGVNDECELSGWAERYQEREAAALDALLPAESLERLEGLHRELHVRFLQGVYRADASDMRRLLDGGEHNCLSSVALMFALTQAAGLPVEIRLEQGHVNLRYVPDGEGALVIEPGSLSTMPRRAIAPASRLLSPVQLVGKFYYNRGVELLQRDQFAEGLELLVSALLLDPDDASSRANLVAGINNWAAACCADGDYSKAAHLIRLGLRLDSNFAPLIANQQLVQAKLGQRQ
jgi:hypothetical protein